MRIELPIRTVSEANQREHWAQSSKRHAEHRIVTAAFLRAKRLPPAPVIVTLTRLAPRELDDDNLSSAFKHVRDGVADAYGIDDRHKELLRFHYAQETAADYGVQIEIEEATDVSIERNLHETHRGHI